MTNLDTDAPLCVDCKHVLGSHGTEYLCGIKPFKRHPVDGAVFYHSCASQRGLYGCGKEGNYFEPKEKPKGFLTKLIAYFKET